MRARISKKMKEDIVQALHFTELNYSEIARSLGVRRDIVHQVAKDIIDEKPLTDDELACSNTTEGFINYIMRCKDGI